MKSLFIAVIGMFVCQIQVNAQQKQSGAIQFESHFDPAAVIEANGVKLTDEMRGRLPESSKTDFELLYNAITASYTKVEDTEDSNRGGRGGFRFGGAANRDYYYNFLDHKLTAVFDLNDTTYFMDTKLGEKELSMGNRGLIGTPVVEYIKSDEVRKIIGFDCHKVTIKTTSKRKIMDEEKEVVDQTILWYTKDLGFDFSPNPSQWTEGAVLAIQSKGASILATSIEFRKVNAKDVSLPKKGTVITPEAYAAKMEYMMKMRGRGNGQRKVSVN